MSADHNQDVQDKGRQPLEAKVPALLQRYAEEVESQLQCFDRIVLQGTLVDVAYPAALSKRLQEAGLSLGELTAFAQPLRDEICANAQRLAREAGAEVEFVSRKNFRQEERIAEVLARRGRQPGLVHVFRVKERATVFDLRRHGERKDQVRLIMRPGQCLHFYFYFLHERLGLLYVRVPTWLPLRLQVYLNGHSVLAQSLAQAQSGHELCDNAFLHVAEPARAQALSDGLKSQSLHTELAALARLCCPPSTRFAGGYHWSFMQVEYAWDIVFESSAVVETLFDELARAALQTVRCEDVARFLGKTVPAQRDTELASHFGGRAEALRLRHRLGPAALKLYSKQHRILRLECTTNDVSFFRHHREVEHKDGRHEYKVAAMKKNLSSLAALREVMRSSLQRYLDWLGTLLEHSEGQRRVDRLGQAQRDQAQRSHRAWNLFRADDRQLLRTAARGEFAAAGLSNRRLRELLPEWKSSRLSRALKRLRVHGLVKKIGRSYRYYLTKLGRGMVIAALRLHEQIVVPALATPA
jgi:hypothetical protein